jgi:hypothetical protein
MWAFGRIIAGGFSTDGFGVVSILVAGENFQRRFKNVSA